ncbi:unnamed protein product [Diabrotica balteata]|uniref:Uncharacterized protein n=1 Tax=Diabrotica balteata TaxID=107213 RepID=A0A9N9SX18_DIABA|nr:unnamed protein product [Diabrotica balteata]
MVSCGPLTTPGASSSTMKVAAALDRLTDTSKYTGTYKQTFGDTGKGKGITEKKDIVDSSGYVRGFQYK